MALQWTSFIGAILMVVMRNEAIISNDAGYIGVIMILLAIGLSAKQ